MPESRKIFEAEDSDFGGGAWVPWKCILPLKWVPQVPRIRERETTDPKPTEADHERISVDQSDQLPACRQPLPWDYFRVARHPPGTGAA